MIKSGLIWPWAIAAFLTFDVVLAIVLLNVATGDPATAVETNYYEKGLNWDASQAAQRASDALGWSSDLRVVAAPGDGRTHRVVIRLTDAHDVAVDNAAVAIECFANARAGNRLAVRCRAEGAGVYVADINATHGGIWEFRLRAERGDDVFLSTSRTSLLRDEVAP